MDPQKSEFRTVESKIWQSAHKMEKQSFFFLDKCLKHELLPTIFFLFCRPGAAKIFLPKNFLFLFFNNWKQHALPHNRRSLLLGGVVATEKWVSDVT